MGKKTRSRRKGKQTKAEAASRHEAAPGLVRNWVIGLILGATFLVFANSLTNGFTYDDRTFILQNELVRTLSEGKFSNLITVFTKELWIYRQLKDRDPSKEEQASTPYYRPMFSVYQMLCWALFQKDSPAGWHLANIIVHLFAVYFAFLILEKVTGSLGVSAIATLLFAVHPLRSESVAWLCGISDPFLAALLLPSFYIYLRYREAGARKYLIGSLGLFLLAAFAKEPAVALAIFIAAYEVFLVNEGRRFLERVKLAFVRSSAFFAVSAAYFGMRYYALGFVFHDNKFTDYPPHQILLTIPLVLWKYLALLFWPVNLSIYHSTPLVQTPLDVRFILPVLGLAVLAPLVWFLKGSTAAKFGALWFGVHLLPLLNLSAFPEDFMVQERYVYVPSIGFSLLVSLALMKVPVDRWLAVSKRATAQLAVGLLVTLVLAGRTLAQNPVWKDDMTLFTHGARVASDQPIAHFILGHQYIKLLDMAKAVEALEAYVKLEPDNSIVLTNLASAHLVVYETQVGSGGIADRAHIDRAIALADRGLSIEQENAALWDTLGRAYTYETELKNFAKARACFGRALAINPDMALANVHIGFTYLKEGNLASAMSYLETARQQQPDFADTYKFLGHTLAAQGKEQEAIENLSRYLDLHPNALDAAKERKFLEQLREKLKKPTTAS